MPPDAGASLRRTFVALAIALYFLLAGLNVANLSVVLSLPEPRRSVRLAMVALSYLAGLFGVIVLVRDVRGRPLPAGVCLKPAWIVVGLSLVDAYFASGNVSFLVVGLLAVAVGLWAVGMVFAGRRRNAAG